MKDVHELLAERDYGDGEAGVGGGGSGGGGWGEWGGAGGGSGAGWEGGNKLELKDEQFLIDGQAIRLRAGEIHPGRIPFEFWEDRIKKIKALGLNTVSVYIFWNEIEPKEGEFVFTDQTDVRRFVKLCQENGLWVVLRVGTYVCVRESGEFGGYPAWMLKQHDMEVAVG